MIHRRAYLLTKYYGKQSHFGMNKEKKLLFTISEFSHLIFPYIFISATELMNNKRILDKV